MDFQLPLWSPLLAVAIAFIALGVVAWTDRRDRGRDHPAPGE